MFSGDRIILQSTLDKIQNVVEAAPLTKILECVLLKLDGDRLTMTVSDNQVQARADCQVTPGKGDKDDAGVAVSARKFRDILSSLSSNDVKFKQTKSELQITSGKSQFKLATRKAEEFPLMAVEGAEIMEIELGQIDLLASLRRLQTSISSQTHRLYLAGAYFDFLESGLHLVGTDGHRLAADRIDTKFDPQETGFILPRKAVMLLVRLLATDEDAKVKLRVVKEEDAFRAATFEMPGTQLTAQLIAGLYPDYAKVIPDPKVNTVHLRFETKDLLARVKQACTVQDKPGDPVQLQMQGTGPAKLVVESKSSSDSAEVEVPVECDQEANLECKINSTYMLDMLQAFEGFEKITLAFKDGQASILCLPGAKASNLQYVVMPVR